MSYNVTDSSKVYGTKLKTVYAHKCHICLIHIYVYGHMYMLQYYYTIIKHKM
jgi:hypothetical protein